MESILFTGKGVRFCRNRRNGYIWEFSTPPATQWRKEGNIVLLRAVACFVRKSITGETGKERCMKHQLMSASFHRDR